MVINSKYQLTFLVFVFSITEQQSARSTQTLEAISSVVGGGGASVVHPYFLLNK